MGQLISYTSSRPIVTAPIAAGVWWDVGCWIPSTLATSAISAGTMYAQKLKLPFGVTITRVFCETTIAAAAGKLIRHGLYTVGADGLPGALLYDTGSLAADAAAGDIGADVSMMLPYDELYAVTLSDGTPTLRSYVTERAPQVMGWRSAVTAVTKESQILKTQAYGALPATFGTPTSYGNTPLRVGIKT